MAHFKYAPSKMQRTMECPASIALEALYQDTRNEYADEGTVAHDIGSRCLQDKTDAERFIGRSADVVATGVDEGKVVWGKGRFTIDDDFADYVQVYLNDVRRRAEGNLLLVEQKVRFDAGESAGKQGGTSDAVVYSAEERCLTVEDLKFGRGVKVYASYDGKPNEQAATYALATLETLDGLIGEVDKIVLVICQPRLDHLDEFEMSIAELRAFATRMKDRIEQAEVACAILADGKEIPDVYFNPGEKQCTFCKHKAHCTPLAAWISKTVMDDFKALDDPNTGIVGAKPRVPGRDKIGIRHGNLGLISGWCKAVNEEVYKLVGAGEEIIGIDGKPMKFVTGKKGNRGWIDEKKAEATLAGHLSADKLYKPREIISPAGADDILNKKKTKKIWETIVPLYKQGEGAPVLALGSDPRPVHNAAASASEFTDLSKSSNASRDVSPFDRYADI